MATSCCKLAAGSCTCKWCQATGRSPLKGTGSDCSGGMPETFCVAGTALAPAVQGKQLPCITLVVVCMAGSCRAHEQVPQPAQGCTPATRRGAGIGMPVF